jgi:hypothetical protein
MVGVGGTQLARFLGRHRKLVLSYDWEDQDWLDRKTPRDGTLPGEGYTSYMLRVSPIDERDEWEEGDTLQEFHFNGGGEVNDKRVPPEVEEAFEKWYGKLSIASARTGLTIRFVGSLGTEDAVDRLLGTVRSASPHLPVWIAELDEETANKVRKTHEILEVLRTRSATPVADVRTAKADSEVGGRPRKARVKGVSIRLHRDGEEMPFAFMDYGDCWVVSGSVKTQPMEFPDDEAKIIWLLEIMMYQGVKLNATDDGKPNADMITSKS